MLGENYVGESTMAPIRELVLVFAATIGFAFILGCPASSCTGDADCDDGLFCTGEEACVRGQCIGGTDPCPGAQECSEEEGACPDDPSPPNPIPCAEDNDDGLFCTGTEICDPATGEITSSGDPCEEGTCCDEENDECTTCPCNADANCDDADACTSDTCVDGVCLNPPVNIDDGLFCTGAETCDPPTGEITSSGDPCEEGICCDEENDECTTCPCNADTDCDDADECTSDTCIDGVCLNPPVNLGDGLFCTGAETCDPATGEITSSGDPCDEGICCDEEHDECTTCPCVPDPACDDADECTADTCVDGVCLNQPVDIDDGLFCTGAETCNSATGEITSSGGPCDEGICCDEHNDRCATEIGAYSGGLGTEECPYVISTKADFVELRNTPADYDRHFRQTAEIDLDGELFFGAAIAADTDFGASGFQGTAFTGRYDGQSFAIRNYHATTSFGASEYVGVFGYNQGRLQNVVIVTSSIDLFQGHFVGLLCGRNDGTLQDCHSNGQVIGGMGSSYIGALCGRSYNATIRNSSSGGTVTVGVSSSYVGGLTGRIQTYAYMRTRNSYAELSFSTAKVTSGDYSSYVGGFSGMIDCYGYGAMTLGGSRPGYARMYVNNCYAAGDVTVGGDCADTGGFSGVASTVFDLYGNQRHGNAASYIEFCYSVGLVTTGTASSSTGGFNGRAYIARDPLNIDHCLWNTDTSGLSTSSEGSGLNDPQMQDVNSFLIHGWDFEGYTVNGSEDNWRMPPQGHSYPYPLLTWQEM
jgi:hypothetical protein